MAYYLAFSAGSDRVDADFFSYGSNTFSLEWEMSLDAPPSSKGWLLSNGGAGDTGKALQIILGTNKLEFGVWGDERNVLYSALNTPIENRAVYRIEDDGVNFKLYQDEQEVYSGSTLIAGAGTPGGGSLKIGSYFNGSFNAPFNLYSLKVIADSVTTRYYDPSASGGTGSVLPDTIGGNDGTLNNFPTDDSQWVFYSDGVNVTADAAYIINAPNFNSSASATLPQPSSDAAYSVSAPTFAATGDVTLPQPSAGVAYTITSPQFASSASATLPQPQADVAYTVDVPTFSATASATIPGFNASVAYSVQAPTFSATAEATQPQPIANVDYAINTPIFSVQGDATLPQPDATGAFTVGSPQFSVTATATEPGFNASVNYAVSAPTFAGSATATLPQPGIDAAFNVKSPTFSVVAIVGGIAIILDDETNINVPALSTNVDVPALSTNIDL